MTRSTRGLHSAYFYLVADAITVEDHGHQTNVSDGGINYTLS